jgi:hypothetical protein
MELEVRRDMVTSMAGALGEIVENDVSQGRFWFRLSVNGCNNVDQLYLHLVAIGLLDFQARKLCVDLGECSNEEGELLADICGIAEDGVMSFVVSAATEEELEEKTCFFIDAVAKMKEAVSDCLLHSIPSWAIKEKVLPI